MILLLKHDSDDKKAYTASICILQFCICDCTYW